MSIDDTKNGEENHEEGVQGFIMKVYNMLEVKLSHEVLEWVQYHMLEH